MLTRGMQRRGVYCLVFLYGMLGGAFSYALPGKQLKLPLRPHWPPPRYEKKAAHVLRMMHMYQATNSTHSEIAAVDKACLA